MKLLLCISLLAINFSCMGGETATTEKEIVIQLSAKGIKALLEKAPRPVSFFKDAVPFGLLGSSVLNPQIIWSATKKVVEDYHDLTQKVTTSLRPHITSLIVRTILQDYPEAIKQLEDENLLTTPQNDLNPFSTPEEMKYNFS